MSNTSNALDELLSGYFSVFWEKEFGTTADAVRAFVDDVGVEQARLGLAAVRGLLAQHESVAVERLGANFGGYSAEPGNAHKFLHELERLLAEHCGEAS